MRAESKMEVEMHNVLSGIGEDVASARADDGVQQGRFALLLTGRQIAGTELSSWWALGEAGGGGGG